MRHVAWLGTIAWLGSKDALGAQGGLGCLCIPDVDEDLIEHLVLLLLEVDDCAAADRAEVELAVDNDTAQPNSLKHEHSGRRRPT